MPSRTLDAEIDRLYQLPLNDFTAARNALAKQAGGEAGRVRALAKPTVPAWIVNQLYWQERKTWDALISAAQNARSVNRAVLAGKNGVQGRARAPLPVRPSGDRRHAASDRDDVARAAR
jgi:hypothetical protein